MPPSPSARRIFSDARVLSLFNAAARTAGFRIHPQPLVWDKDWLGLGGGAWRSQMLSG